MDGIAVRVCMHASTNNVTNNLLRFEFSWAQCCTLYVSRVCWFFPVLLSSPVLLFSPRPPVFFPLQKSPPLSLFFTNHFDITFSIFQSSNNSSSVLSSAAQGHPWRQAVLSWGSCIYISWTGPTGRDRGLCWFPWGRLFSCWALPQWTGKFQFSIRGLMHSQESRMVTPEQWHKHVFKITPCAHTVFLAIADLC